MPKSPITRYQRRKALILFPILKWMIRIVQKLNEWQGLEPIEEYVQALSLLKFLELKAYFNDTTERELKSQLAFVDEILVAAKTKRKLAQHNKRHPNDKLER